MFGAKGEEEESEEAKFEQAKFEEAEEEEVPEGPPVRLEEEEEEF